MHRDDDHPKRRRRVGDTIHSKYVIERVLGDGGTSIVYAVRRKNNSRAAVKVLRPKYSSDPSMRRRFVNEGHLANRVGHEAVVTVIEDDVDDNGDPFLVMDLLEGIDLQDLNAPGHPVPVTAVLNVGCCLLEALEAAHSKGIVHRDIKPANVKLLPDGRLKIFDFGIAKAPVEDGSAFTEAGMVLGTPAFMAPEQVCARPGDVDARCDLWAVGATLLSLLRGQEAMRKPLWKLSGARRVEVLNGLHPAVPVDVIEILSKALQIDKSDRWQSAAEMRRALQLAQERHFGPMRRETLKELVTAQLAFIERHGEQARGSLTRSQPTTLPSNDHHSVPALVTSPTLPNTRSSSEKTPRTTWLKRPTRHWAAAALALTAGGVGIALARARTESTGQDVPMAELIPGPIATYATAPPSRPGHSEIDWDVASPTETEKVSQPRGATEPITPKEPKPLEMQPSLPTQRNRPKTRVPKPRHPPARSSNVVRNVFTPRPSK